MMQKLFPYILLAALLLIPVLAFAGDGTELGTTHQFLLAIAASAIMVAIFLMWSDRPNYYVLYPDGAKSALMPRYQAKIYARIFDGKIIKLKRSKIDG